MGLLTETEKRKQAMPPSFQLLHPSFRRKPESTPCVGMQYALVIPAQAGIYALRKYAPVIPPPPPVIPAPAGIYRLQWNPVFAGATDPHLNHLKRNAARIQPP